MACQSVCTMQVHWSKNLISVSVTSWVVKRKFLSKESTKKKFKGDRTLAVYQQRRKIQEPLLALQKYPYRLRLLRRGFGTSMPFIFDLSL